LNKALHQKLESLRADYNKVRDRPFDHFYCPILFRDEDVSLCKAHIVNQAFPNSARAWTVQRKDVDNFYGANFEADFVAMKYVDPQNHIAWDAIANKERRKLFKPSIQIDGEPVEYYDKSDKVPEQFTSIRFEDDITTTDLVLKMPTDEALNKSQRNWEVVVQSDLRIPALVTLLKAAHLTLFELIGYRYALSPAGRFVGHDILGSFYLQNMNASKNTVIQNAEHFFQEFAHMVLPVKPMPNNMRGTITDKMCLVCGRNTSLWATIIIVKTGESLNAVLLPAMDQPDSVARFLAFLKDKNERIEYRLYRYENDRWLIESDFIECVWPK